MGSHEALLAAVAVKATLSPVEGDHLVHLVGRLADIDTLELKARQKEVTLILEAQSRNLKDQVHFKIELRKQSIQWSQAVEKCNFDIAEVLLLRALNNQSS